MPECAGVRRLGSAALDLAYVAAGRQDGYWEREILPWDIAAGMLIVTEAGGFVGPIREGHKPLEHGDIIAANAAIFEKFAAVIRERP
jgi:myo-inositol-1(or 4)-monophosphatase